MLWLTPLNRPALCLLLASCAISTASGAERGEAYQPHYSVELGVGLEYDSNVSIDEVDVTSSESDYALTMDAEFRARQQFTDKTEGSLTYDLSQSLYQEFSLVDRQTHLIGGDVDTRLNGVRANLSVYYIHSRLDNDPFLTLYRTSPALSGFINKKWFARGAYVYSDKRIEDSPERNAITHSGELDLYYFNRGLRSYFNLGYKHRNEDARLARLDYISHTVKLRYVHRMDLFQRLVKMEFSWRYEDRNYRSITPTIGEQREDDRSRWGVNVEFPVAEKTTFQFYYGYGDYESNYPTSDYVQNVVGTRFNYLWD